MKEAIQKAIEGGYDIGQIYNRENVLLNPLFWQYLGKNLGWGKTDFCFGCGYDEGATQDTEIWLVNWHQFIDHLAKGGNADSFFNELLK